MTMKNAFLTQRLDISSAPFVNVVVMTSHLILQCNMGHGYCDMKEIMRYLIHNSGYVQNNK